MITFENIHKGQTAYIIGKGKSLDRLKLCDIKAGIIIAINQAIIPVEKIGFPNITYSLQKDGASPEFRNECQCKIHGHKDCPYDMVYPKKAILINHTQESSDCMTDYTPRIVFNNEDFGLEWQRVSALSAIAIAKYFGCDKIKMIAFDSITDNDCGNMMDKIDESYPIHHSAIHEALKDIEHEFIRL